MLFFTVQKMEVLLQELKNYVCRDFRDIPAFKYHVGDVPGAEKIDFDDSGWEDFQVGGLWGGYDVTAWFRAQVPIPSGWENQRLALRFLVGPRDDGESTAETMLHVNGLEIQGIDVWHEEAWLPPELLQEGGIIIALKAWSGVLGVPAKRCFKLAKLVWLDESCEKLAYLTDTLLRVIRVQDENDLRRIRILQVLNQAYLKIDFLVPGSEEFYGTVADALGFLQRQMEEWASMQEMKPVVVGIGHAHIDMAWLWRMSHTREKAARTFATVLHLMRQYPEYRFLHSSPALYKFLKRDHPALFARVKKKIASGEWEVTGGTWVEPDTNCPSGESLVRQFLFGRRFVREEFGQEMNLLWLPDVFGYSAALPQIILKSGMKYFMTTKISWSQFNRFPHDTFLWRGLDGSEVLTHFVTTPEAGGWIYTYNGQMRPEDVHGIWKEYRQKEINDELLLIYGWGDGGGGPTREMLEWSLAQRNLPGQPYVRLDKAEPFFDRLAKRLEGKNLPVWDGELYLEYHRGTYTSQAAVKRANRKVEILYHNAEWLASLADILTGLAAYPAEDLNAGWETILLNQFHDILPGSSIHPVYEDTLRELEEVSVIGDRVVNRSAGILAERTPIADGVMVMNSLSWQRGDLVEVPLDAGHTGKTMQSPDGTPLVSQRVDTAEGSALLVNVTGIPSLGYQALVWTDARLKVRNDIRVTPTRLETPFYTLELNSNGQLTSIFDRRSQREVLAPGFRGNVLQTFEDKPMNFDAWDIDIYYQEKMKEITDLVEAVVEEEGPLRGTLRLVWRFGRSTMTQRLQVYATLPRIDFVTVADWHEEQVLLKTAFPVNVRSTRATYEIQFGSLERPTHWNTSWDWARFEVSGHRWADLSEGNFGVALMNDCKYGYDIKNQVMRLTLIKSAIHPDPLADKGYHQFTYSLLPHAGDWREGDVTRQAAALNIPLLVHRIGTTAPGGSLPLAHSFASVNAPHVLLDTVKRAEDGDGWVIRLYEYQQMGCAGVHVRFGTPVRRAVECDLMEENLQPVQHDATGIHFPIRPFEIKTFRVWF